MGGPAIHREGVAGKHSSIIDAQATLIFCINQTQCFAKPVTDDKLLEITFPFMDEDTLYEIQPSRYFSHLIGHEGPGSILAYLKEKGWLIGLSAGADSVSPDVGLFSVNMSLTDEGLGKSYPRCTWFGF